MTDARKYLESIRAAKMRIQLKLKRVQDLRDSLTSLTVPLDHDQVSHSRNVDIMADTVALIKDMEREIDQQTCALLTAKKEAYQLLDQIQPDYASILTSYYFEQKSTDELARLMHMSRRQAQRNLSAAIDAFQSVLDSG